MLLRNKITIFHLKLEVASWRPEDGLNIYILLPLSSPRPHAAGEAITGDCEAGMRGRNPELLSGGENIPGAGSVLRCFLLDRGLGAYLLFALVSCVSFLSHTLSDAGRHSY